MLLGGNLPQVNFDIFGSRLVFQGFTCMYESCFLCEDVALFVIFSAFHVSLFFVSENNIGFINRFTIDTKLIFGKNVKISRGLFKLNGN